jgi:outer membrane protein TolC
MNDENTKRGFFHSIRRAALIALPLLFTACSVGPDYVTPTAPTPAANYKESGDWKPAQPKDDMIRGKWWEIYHDPQLNALEEQVNISNQNVIQAEAQFREAAAAVKVARAAFFPTVTANPAYTNRRPRRTSPAAAVPVAW